MPTHLDPELDPDLVPTFPITAESLPIARQGGLREVPPPSERVGRTVHEVSNETGVTVTIHRPVDIDGARPALYWIHGGGYVTGSVEMDGPMFDRYCTDLGIIGVSIDYRLAPEHPYPTPLDDVYEGLASIFARADELGIDPHRIGIGGVSAGGGLCAALALLVRDRDEFAVRFQLLDCPMIDDTMTTASSRRDDLLLWPRQSNEFGWRSYLGDRYGTADIPAYAAATRATDLTGLPPAYVCVGTADGFCDEDIAYAARLMAADVPTELHVYPGAPHGVAYWTGTELATMYRDDQVRWLHRQFAALG